MSEEENEYKKLLEDVKLGEKSEIALEVLEGITNDIIEKCKDDFVNLPLNYNQILDKNNIYMLQLKIVVAKEIQSSIKMRIFQMDLAKEKLRSKNNGTRRIC